MNENQKRDETTEGLEGRQDFRRGMEVPRNLFGKDRAREYNTDQPASQGPGLPTDRSLGTSRAVNRAPRSEEEMRASVRQALANERDLAEAEIQTEVHDGVILLRGRVQNARMRALAEDCLDEISYVHVIRNEIEVRAGARGFPSTSAPTGPVIRGDLEVERAGKRDGQEPISFRRSA